MKTENSVAQAWHRILEEVRAARTRNDRWLLVHLTRKGDGAISLGADTVFEGFRDSRELRGPRWRTLANAQEFSADGFSWMVAGELTAYVLFHQLLADNVPKGVIMHCDAVHRWAPQCAEITPTVNSVHGFLNADLSENRGRSAKRPGRITRARLTSSGCQLCGSKLEVTLHHLIPRQMGGATEEENLLSVCRPCHDAIHSGTIDVTDLVMEVSVKRTVRLLQTANDKDLSGSSADDV
jgi:hypothetical protein